MSTEVLNALLIMGYGMAGIFSAIIIIIFIVWILQKIDVAARKKAEKRSKTE